MIQAIKATVIKEARENLRWAGVILLATSVLLIAGLYDNFNSGLSVLGNTFLKICMGMYPVAGLALGLLQIFQDSRKGRWQFISHRPMPRSLMLGCKVVVGMSLYLLSTLTPLLLVTLWVSAPGHVAGPFTWDMVEPALGYLLWGLMWYACGLLVAARRARWFGSRLMPLGGAVAGSWACYALCWTLSESIALTFLTTAFLLVGMLGVYLRGGETVQSPVWSKPTIALSMLIGWGCVLGASMGLGDAAIRAVYPSRESELPFRLYHSAKDGQVLVWTMSKGEVIASESLTGNAMPLPTGSYWANDTPPSATIYYSQYANADATTYRAFHEGFLQSQTHVIPLGNNSGNPWFYLTSRRVFEEYDQQTRRYLASLGPGGLSPPGAETTPFPPSAKYSNIVGSSAFITSPDAVYLFDLSVPKISKIYTASPADPVLTATSNVFVPYGQLALPQPTFTVITTRSAFHILQDNLPTVMIPVDQKLETRSIQINRTPTGGFIIAYGLDWPPGWAPLNVFTYDSGGKLISRLDLPATLKRGQNAPDFEAFAALTFFPPSLLATAIAAKNKLGEVPRYFAAMLIAAAFIYATITLVLLRLRHAAWPQFVIWLPAAALLGFLSIPLLLSMTEQPGWVRCVSCRKRRLMTEDRCRNCGTPAAGPALEGIEIFVPASQFPHYDHQVAV